MTYSKPEIAVLGNAARVIQGQPKAPNGTPDPDINHLTGQPAAYDLDE